MSLSSNQIESLYTDTSVPGSLGSLPVFYKSLRARYKESNPQALKGWTQQKVEQVLRGIPAFSLFKHPSKQKRHTKYAQVVTHGSNSQWQCDLMEFPAGQGRVNKGYNYILICVDVFSKRAYTKALKTKEGTEVAQAFKVLFAAPTLKKVPRTIQSDSGKEFHNRHVSSLFRDHGIRHFSTYNTEKAQMAERLIRTLKIKLKKIQQINRDGNWIDHYQDVTQNYNRTAHSALAMAPNEVTPETEGVVRERLYHGQGRYPPKDILRDTTGGGGGKKKRRIRTLPEGAYVRLFKSKGTFEKESTRLWTTEVFKISKVWRSEVPVRYSLVDLDGEEIKGTFYGWELQQVDLPKRWAVHKQRVDKKSRLVLVSFDSIPNKLEWVRPSHLRQGLNKKWWYTPPSHTNSP